MAAERDDLVAATARVREVREGVTKKLDQYREQYEEMHIRALTAEMEVASVKLKLDSVLRDIQSHKSTVIDLIDQLGIERERNSENETGLRVAKDKIAKVRSKLRTEFDKMLNNQKDLRLGVNSFMRCVHEYRSEVISKQDFFCAVDLIFSSLLANDKHFASSPRTLGDDGSHDNRSHVEVLFSGSSLQELVALPPEQRRQKLELVIDRLSSDSLFSQTPDRLLSYVFEDTAPPILPKKPTLPPKPPKSMSKATNLVIPPPLPPKVHLSVPSSANVDDSDSDFEGNEEIQRIRLSNHTSSEPNVKDLGADIVGNRNKATMRRKMNKKRVLRRSKSCDNVLSEKIPSTGSGSDTDEYSLPYQHLEAWHKMVSIRDSSVLTGSLPRLNVINDSDEVCYVTPNDFKAFVCQVRGAGEKIGYRASTRVMKRVDSLLKSYCSRPGDQDDYIRLIGDSKDDLRWRLSIMKPKKPKKPSSSVHQSRSRLNYENHIPGKQFSPKKSASPTPPPPPSSTRPLVPQRGDSKSSGGRSSPRTPTPSAETTFDDPVYETRLPPSSSHAIVDYNFAPPTATRLSPVPLKSHLVDIELQRRASDTSISEGDIEERPPALLPRPVKPRPPPRPRINKGGSETPPSREIPVPIRGPESEGSAGKFPDPIPTYCTLKRNTHSLRLVPILHPGTGSSSTSGQTGSESEEDPGDYSLGTFQFVMNRATTNASSFISSSERSKKMTKAAVSSDSDDDSDPYEMPPDAAEGYVEPSSLYNGGGPERGRSYTANLVTGNKVIEKQGYMHKLDPSLKRWTRRWFVLKGKELKYFSNVKSRKPKGVINLETWCKISRHEMTSSFQLATPSRTYHFVADANSECEEWIKALQTTMRMCQSGSAFVQSEDIVSGWVKLVLKDSDVLKCWVSIVDQMLQVYHSLKDTTPLYVFSLQNAVMKTGADVPSNAASKHPCVLSSFCTKEEYIVRIEMGEGSVYLSEDEEKSVTLILGSKEEQELWFYHLVSASSGDTGPELTLTEKLVASLWRLLHSNPIADDERTADTLWSNPQLSYTSESIQDPLLSHPSTAQASEAVEMFKLVNLFMNTPFDSLAMDYHIMSLQQMVSKCLSSPGLRDELYCQILRQISAVSVAERHSQSAITNILQGWFLLALLIPLFIPTRKIFDWYLKTVLLRVSENDTGTKESSVPGVVEVAQMCHQRFLRAEKKGPREKTPSWFEMQYLMSGPVHVSRFLLALKLKLPVKLMNDTTLMMEFDPSTEVQEFTSHLNQEIGMPDSETTGFALMSDWPGEDDEAGFYLFPSNKLCDVISTWSESLSELGNTNAHTRLIQLTYKKRLHFCSRRGEESDKEALLLTYQVSKDVLNEYYYVSKVDLALDIAARMAQIDYGDYDSLTDQHQVARDAIRRFCPIKFTKMILPHDMEVMVDRLLNYWKGYHGINRHACARMLLSLFADNWNLFGSTLFYCTDRYSVLTSVKNGTVWLAVHENGITLLSTTHLVKPIVSFSYKEVATFGGHCDDFMLVVNSRKRSTRSMTTFNAQQTSTGPFHTEKILLSMSKLKIREATYLMASYMDMLNSNSTTGGQTDNIYSYC